MSSLSNFVSRLSLVLFGPLVSQRENECIETLKTKINTSSAREMEKCAMFEEIQSLKKCLEEKTIEANRTLSEFKAEMEKETIKNSRLFESRLSDLTKQSESRREQMLADLKLKNDQEKQAFETDKIREIEVNTTHLKVSLQEKDYEILQLKESIRKKDSEIHSARTENSKLNSTVLNLQRDLSTLSAKFDALALSVSSLGMISENISEANKDEVGSIVSAAVCTRALESSEERMCLEASKVFKIRGGGDYSTFVDSVPDTEVGSKAKFTLKAIKTTVDEKNFERRLSRLKVSETAAKVSSEASVPNKTKILSFVKDS